MSKLEVFILSKDERILAAVPCCTSFSGWEPTFLSKLLGACKIKLHVRISCNLCIAQVQTSQIQACADMMYVWLFLSFHCFFCFLSWLGKPRIITCNCAIIKQSPLAILIKI